MGRFIPLTLILLGVIATVIVLLPIAPWPGSPLGTDPGVFLYMGRKILSGSIPYRDVWDHKPPLIYYENALGLLISGQSRWGVWLIEVLSLFSAAALSFLTTAKTLGKMPALFGTGIWLISLPLILKEGNYTEEFALPFQFAAIYLFQRASLSYIQSEKRWPWIGIGAAISLAFLYRPNLVGIGLAIVLTLLCLGLFQRLFRDTILKLALIALGFALVIVPVGLYFFVNNALYDLWSAVFLYNFSYVQEHIVSTQFDAILAGINYLGDSSIVYIALFGWLCGLTFLLRIRLKLFNPSSPHLHLLLVPLLGLPIEPLLSSISLRPFAHYYIAWLPVLGLLSAVGAYFISNFAVALTKRKILWLAPVLRFSPLILLCGLVFQVTLRIWPAASSVITAPPFEYPVVSYIRNTTTADESVLIWGAAVRYNFDANRDAPGKYAYQWPLYVAGYATESDVSRFLHDLQTGKPRLIVDTSTTFTLVPPLDPPQRSNWLLHPPIGYTILPGMDKVFSFIQANYTNAGEIPQTQWTAYIYTGP